MVLFKQVQESLNHAINLFASTKTDFCSSAIKYKRCSHYLVVLYIDKTIPTNEKRGCVANPMCAKFRAEKAWCVAIVHENGTYVDQIQHQFQELPAITYQVGAWVIPSGYTEDVEEVCAPGIHFFNHLLPAFFYGYFAVYGSWTVKLRNFDDEYAILFHQDGLIMEVCEKTDGFLEEYKTDVIAAYFGVPQSMFDNIKTQ